MKLIKVAAAVLNQTPLDWAGNKARIIAAIECAREQNVKLLCLPEMCICGYGCEDAFHSPGVHATAWQMLKEILPSTHGIAVCLGLPIMHRNGIFNCAALVADTEVIGFVAKRYLAGDGIHYEPRWFKPWPNGVCAEIEIDGKTYPIGDIHFSLGGVRIGFEICEDAWVAKRPGGNLSLEGVDVILNPSASHFAFGKIETRKRFVLEGSRAFGVTYVYANLLGNESGRAIYDGGALIASSGRLLAMGSRLSFKAFDITTAVVDIDATRMSQARTASFMPVLNPQEKNMADAKFTWPEITPEPAELNLEEWERSPNIKEEEFFRAETLALFDYMRKSHSTGFVVSLSGGADSAACACLVSMMLERALKELGPQELASRLNYIRGITTQTIKKDGAEGLANALLTCVYQATENSSSTTRNAAKTVAKTIGAEFIEFNVDSLVKDYVSIVSKGVGRKLDWERDDVALQNIQARVRAPGVWMIANIKDALLLTTSNRSEAAVGYATMDGDTAGGLAPIAGIDKHYLRKWLRWLEKDGPLGMHSIAALSAINVQAPTAELRPQESKQTDEDDLMPYELLDAVERAVIRDKRTPLEALGVVRLQFPQYGDKQLGIWIERFFKLWCRNQWKRERYAPSFHLDDENLDPKTWCRFPILSGGFERELEQMRKSLK